MTDKERRPLGEAMTALRATVQAAYELAPVAVVFILFIASTVVAVVANSARGRVAVVLLVVFVVAVLIYAGTRRYGEAALALSAGLISVYSVNWTTPRFIAFVAVWVGFSVLALLISSVSLAAKSESIYRDASLAAAPDVSEYKAVEKELQKIGKDPKIRRLGPIERAEALRLFAYRKLPVPVMRSALQAVDTLSLATQTPPATVTRFVGDTYRVFSAVAPLEMSRFAETLFSSIRDSAVPPADFYAGFEASRHLLLSGEFEPEEFLTRLRTALEHGVPTADLTDYLREGE